MAEDYSNTKFNSYNTEESQSHLDNSSLYVKSVPAYLTEDAFQSRFSQFGRIVRFKLYPPRLNYTLTCGLVTFETPLEAQGAMRHLNRKPPLNLEISYANAKPNHATLKDVNKNLTENEPATLSNSITFGRGRSQDRGQGRGQPMPAERLTHLKIKVDGNKRVATSYIPDENKEHKSLSKPLIPKLILNQYCFCRCKKPGEYCCEVCNRPYCSSACQAEDWNHHKSICEPLSVKKEIGVPLRQCKYDKGYVSECNNDSENEKKTASNQQTNLNKNTMQNLPSKFQSSHLSQSPESEVSQQKAFHKRSPQGFGSSRNESVKKLTFIKSNEIEDSALPIGKDEKVYVCNFQSPSKLWLHLKTARSVISEMEKRLSELVDKSAVTCAVNDVCCTLRDGALCRIKVTEVKLNAITAEFIDFGDTSIVKEDLIYHLPLTFRKYPSQAICCKLVEDNGRVNAQWNEEDFTSFHKYTEGKEFKVKAYRCSNNIYDVSIVNEEGVSLYVIAQSSVEPFVENPKPSVNLLNQVPSFLSNLKIGMEVNIKAIEFNEEKFWGVMDDGSGYQKCLTDLECLLETDLKGTKVINMSCEEGDVAVGFSVLYEKYYRCVVLKRLKSSFLVRFIDFGNTEEITEVRSATLPLLEIRSHVFCCTKPDSLSFEKFKKAFENTVRLSVKSAKSLAIELSFMYENHPLILQCFPWDHRISDQYSQTPTCNIQGKEETSFKSNTFNSSLYKGEVKCNENKFSVPLKQTSLVAHSLSNKCDGNLPKLCMRVMKSFISDKELSVGSKHNVNISFIKTASEMYVQFTEDTHRISSLSEQINQHCATDICQKYCPVKDEIVCCKFSDDKKWYRAEVLEKFAGNKFKVLFIDYGNEEIVLDVNIKPLPEKFTSAKLSACVSLCNIKNEDISNLLDKLLKELWIMEVKDSSKCAKVMLFQGHKSLLEFLSVENKFLKSSLNFQKLPIGISEVVICHKEGENLYLHQVKDEEAIRVLQIKINTGDNKALPSKPQINNVYCCRFTDDGLWYRACVQNEAKPNIFRVNFIDFGNDGIVSPTDFKEISNELFTFPVYCIPVITDTVNIGALNIGDKYSVQVVDEKEGIPKVTFLNFSEGSQTVCLSSLEKLTLKNGINEVVFCHSENGIYYCHSTENTERYADMSSKLMTVELKPLVKAPQVGEVVCAKSIDGTWYRASLDSIHNSNYKVLFIDFGNTELVSSENVKILPIDFHEYPIFSISVRIKNVTEAKVDFASNFLVKASGFASDGSQFVEIVLSKNIDLPNISSFDKMLLPVDKEEDVTLCFLENNIYYAHMTSSQELIESLKVELQNASAFEDLSGLPNAGDVVCAKYTDGIWYRGLVKNVCDDQKSCQIFFIDYGNSEVIEFTDLKILPSNLCAIPILSVPMKFLDVAGLENKTDGSVFKIKVVERSSDNVPIVDFVKPENILSPSIEAWVLPESLTEVTVSCKKDELVYVQKTSDVECLRDFMNNLQIDASMKAISSPKVGQLVCVKFHDDGYLYRGLIKEISGNIVKAFFVDYGKTDTVTEIFTLPSKYSSIPMFSIPVIISNEKSLASPLIVDFVCQVKYTGKMIDGIQVVRVCPTIDHILLPSIKACSLEKGYSEVYFHNFDGQFYFVNKAIDIAKLNKLKSMLKNFTGDEIYHVPSVEELLLVKCEEIWYRGCVGRIDETKKACEVFLIDEGFTKIVPFSNMSYLPRSVTSFPIFLIKVSMSPDDLLKTSITLGKCYTITVVENSTNIPAIKVLQPVMFTSIERKSLPVNQPRNVCFFHKENDVMFLQDTNDVVHIAQIYDGARKCASSEVISHNPIVGELLCAQSDSDGNWYRCCIEEVVGSDSYKIHYIDFGNSEVVSKQNLRYLSSSLSMYPSFGIAVRILDLPTVALERSYSVIAVSEPVNGIQSVKLLLEENEKDEPNPQFLYSSLKQVPIFPGEKDIAIYSVAEEDKTCCIFCTPFISDNIEANLKLTVEITEYCNSLNCSSYNGDSLPIKGEMVLARFEDDQNWYRAVVIDCSDPFYEVLFADFGNAQTSHINFLRKMEKKFMSLAIQAVDCTLIGFKTIDGDMTSINKEVKNFTISFISEPLKAILTIKDNEVDIEIPVITKHLIKKGLAVAT